MSGDRGFVTPVDEGEFEVLAWAEDRVVVELKLFSFSGRAVFERYFGEGVGSLWRVSLKK